MGDRKWVSSPGRCRHQPVANGRACGQKDFDGTARSKRGSELDQWLEWSGQIADGFDPLTRRQPWHQAGHVYADEGVSGKRADNRPGLQAALAEACGAKGVLVAYDLRRLGRSTRDAIDIADRLRRAGA